MSSNNQLQYLFIGDIKTKKEIGTYESKIINQDIIKKSKDIFRYMNNFDKKNKIFHNSSVFYFTITSNNILLLAVVNKDSFPLDERTIYELFDDIDNQGLWKYVDKTGELNNVGRQNLQYLIDKYQDVSARANLNTSHNSNDISITNDNKILQVNSQINEIKYDMKSNVKKMVMNLDNVRDLDNKAGRIKNTSLLFKRDAENLRRTMRWRNMKYMIILIVIAVIGLIYLLLS